MRRSLTPILVAAAAALTPSGCSRPSGAASSRGTIQLAVDATDAPRRVLRAKLVLPARSGENVFFYPKWIPGEHGPTGPVRDLVGVKMSAGGKPLAWRRDGDDMYAFRVDAPSGTSAIDAELELLLPGESDGFSAAASSTDQLLDLSWNQIVLYPKGGGSDDWTVAPRLRLPAGWKLGTALRVASQSGGETTFAPVSLTTLVDSPVVAGAHFRSVPVSSGPGPAHVVDMVADSEAALEVQPKTVEAWKRLVAESGALFGARHYDGYHFLLTLSDHVASFGLEHHESSDNRVRERSLVDDDKLARMAGLLPHEFAHSWNGKYRRPEGLATPDYQQPMRGDLLWVYEGLTTYLGMILGPRSGLSTAERLRDDVAALAATLDAGRPGRAWRSLEDTAVAAQLLYGAPREGSSSRRGVDFYPEGFLLWLEADVIVREATSGARSLDDFCHAFHGGKDGGPAVRPYSLDDLVKTLDGLARHDWRGLFRERLDAHGPGAPLGGIAGSGWRLEYAAEPTAGWKAAQADRKTDDQRFSLGIVLGDDGAVQDCVDGSPAARSGVGPHMKVVAVDERRYSPEVLRGAIRRAKAEDGATGRGPEPIRLLVENGEWFHTYDVEWRGGERYPRLVRDESRPDLLADILRPHASAPAETVPAVDRK